VWGRLNSVLRLFTIAAPLELLPGVHVVSGWQHMQHCSSSYSVPDHPTLCPVLQGTDVPFAHTLAQYPVHRQQPLPPTFGDQKDQPPGGHIPPFLPAFPDPHTYQHTAAYAGHQTDPHKQRQVRVVVGWGKGAFGGCAGVVVVLVVVCFLRAAGRKLKIRRVCQTTGCVCSRVLQLPA
jgi:hypothetical protein